MRSANASVVVSTYVMRVIADGNLIPWEHHHVSLHAVERLAHHSQCDHHHGQVDHVAAVTRAVRDDQADESDRRVVADTPPAGEGPSRPFDQDAGGDQGAQAESYDRVGLTYPDDQQHGRRCQSYRSRQQQRAAQRSQVRPTPGQQRADAHQQYQRQHQRAVDLVIEWPGDRDLLLGEQARQQGIHRAPKGWQTLRPAAAGC